MAERLGAICLAVRTCHLCLPWSILTWDSPGGRKSVIKKPSLHLQHLKLFKRQFYGLKSEWLFYLTASCFTKILGSQVAPYILWNIQGGWPKQLGKNKVFETIKSLMSPHGVFHRVRLISALLWRGIGKAEEHSAVFWQSVSAYSMGQLLAHIPGCHSCYFNKLNKKNGHNYR